MSDLIDTRWGDVRIDDPAAGLPPSTDTTVGSAVVPERVVRKAAPARTRTTGARKPAVSGRRPHLRVEKELFRTAGVTRLAGMDEVGRGALAGPVTVGVVVVTLSVGRVPAGLRDSKLLTPTARDALVAPVRRWAADFGVGHAGPEEIDAHGITVALRLAGERALAQLSAPVDAILLDGNHNYLTPRPTTTVDEVLHPADGAVGLFEAPPAVRPVYPPVHVRVKADMTCAAVAAASILAKTERDRLLVRLGERHPRYGFEINKGYGTPEHTAALRRFGPSTVHRRSWRLPGEDPGLFVDGPEADATGASNSAAYGQGSADPSTAVGIGRGLGRVGAAPVPFGGENGAGER